MTQQGGIIVGNLVLKDLVFKSKDYVYSAIHSYMGRIYFAAEESKYFKEENGLFVYHNPVYAYSHTNLVTLCLQNSLNEDIKEIDDWVAYELEYRKEQRMFGVLTPFKDNDYVSWGEVRKRVAEDFHENVKPQIRKGYTEDVDTYLVDTKTLIGVGVSNKDELMRRMEYEMDLDLYPLGEKSGFSHKVHVDDIIDETRVIDFNSLLSTSYREYPMGVWEDKKPIQPKSFDRHRTGGNYMVLLVHSGTIGEMLETVSDGCLDFNSKYLKKVLRSKPLFDFVVGDNTYMVTKEYMG